MTGVRSTPRTFALEGVLSPKTAAPPTPAAPPKPALRRKAASPKTSSPQTSPPKTRAPKTPAAQTSAGTSAPKPKPKATAPKTTAPRTTAPKTTAKAAGPKTASPPARRSATRPANGSAAPALAPEPQPRPSRPEREGDRHLRVVGARPRVAWSGRRRARILCLAASIAAIIVAFGLVYLHVLSAQKQFEINHLTGVEQTAQANYEQLRLAVESANSPARVMAAAERLGMLEPASVTVVKGVGPVGSPGEDVVREGAQAPGGVADYSDNKTNLADPP